MKNLQDRLMKAEQYISEIQISAQQFSQQLDEQLPLSQLIQNLRDFLGKLVPLSQKENVITYQPESQLTSEQLRTSPVDKTEDVVKLLRNSPVKHRYAMPNASPQISNKVQVKNLKEEHSMMQLSTTGLINPFEDQIRNIEIKIAEINNPNGIIEVKLAALKLKLKTLKLKSEGALKTEHQRKILGIIEVLNQQLCDGNDNFSDRMDTAQILQEITELMV
ncbi:Hypothetical_protein [Hexamita inflata]|uniref:Hypothetical_protein n=1 Tax=Hexamita inflata TaxID=28002 RepID=A0AA86PEZ5_9EUKA|nr:Hypothetical protein HINF_LOCUS25003 [Hexamita inflata]